MHCTFCGLNGNAMAYRSKTPARALDELISLGKYGTEIIATDNIVDLKYLDSFFPQLASRKLRFKFSLIETKVNLTKDQLRSLRIAGAIRLQPGIESLSTPVLKLMKKGCNLLQNVQFLKWSKQMGIEAAWNILYGFPGESPAEYLEMARIIPLLRHLDPPSGCGKIRIDRFSPYFARPAEYGITNVRPFKAYSYIYPFEPDVLERLAYHFEFDAPVAPPVEEYVGPLLKKVKVWRSARRRGNLKGTIRQETLLLVDTRKRKKLTTVLQEPLRSSYIFCDQARAFSTILAHVSARFPSRSVAATWLEGALDDLVSRGLMLKDGKSYLSLAILPLPDAPSTAVEREVRYAGVQAEVRVEGLVQLSASQQPTV
jgi:ribosomal peptide maturation radical SAM protein 1